MQQQPQKKRKDELRDTEKEYIRENHKTTPVLKMATHLNRASITIYRFMDQETLTVFSTKVDMSPNHRTPSRRRRGYFTGGSLRELI